MSFPLTGPFVPQLSFDSVYSTLKKLDYYLIGYTLKWNLATFGTITNFKTLCFCLTCLGEIGTGNYIMTKALL